VWFCWSVWLIFGQASGAYVSPKPWATLAIAGAVSWLYLHQPVAGRRTAPRNRTLPTVPAERARGGTG